MVGALPEYKGKDIDEMLWYTFKKCYWQASRCCRWVPYKTINVPSSANFIDYSGMAFSGDRFGIVSQVSN